MKRKLIKISLLAAFFTSASLVQAAVPPSISAHFGKAQIEEDRIELRAPQLAEEGSVVPVTISAIDTGNPATHITEISFFSETNMNCPVSTFKLTPAMLGEGLATRIRLADTTNVHVIARLSDGSVIGGQQTIKVTKGGCGGGSALPTGASGPNNYCKNRQTIRQ